MAQISKQELKNKFKTGMYPSEQDFSNVFDSYVHKDDMVNINKIEQDIEGISVSLPEMLNTTKAEAVNLAKAYADEELAGKVDKITGKGLSSNDYTDEEKAKVAEIDNKVDVVTGKGLSSNDYTDEEKAKVAEIDNKVDVVTGKGLSSNDYTNEEKAKVAEIDNKVDVVTGKGLSSNDYTDEEKAKLATINLEDLTQSEYDDLEEEGLIDPDIYYFITEE